jgi:hypothetical protein
VCGSVVFSIGIMAPFKPGLLGCFNTNDKVNPTVTRVTVLSGLPAHDLGSPTRIALPSMQALALLFSPVAFK